MISSNSHPQGRNYSGFTGSFASATEKPFHHAVADRKPEAALVQAPLALSRSGEGPFAPNPSPLG